VREMKTLKTVQQKHHILIRKGPAHILAEVEVALQREGYDVEFQNVALEDDTLKFDIVVFDIVVKNA
jgi:hypothetical protein